MTTVSDPEKRPTVMDLVRDVKGRVYPVGRLDWASEGLLLMTNDGALANALMKASSNVPKTYVVKVAGQPEVKDWTSSTRSFHQSKGGRRRTAPAKIAHPRRRQSLARSNDHRRPQPPDPEDV